MNKLPTDVLETVFSFVYSKALSLVCQQWCQLTHLKHVFVDTIPPIPLLDRLIEHQIQTIRLELTTHRLDLGEDEGDHYDGYNPEVAALEGTPSSDIRQASVTSAELMDLRLHGGGVSPLHEEALGDSGEIVPVDPGSLTPGSIASHTHQPLATLFAYLGRMTSLWSLRFHHSDGLFDPPTCVQIALLASHPTLTHIEFQLTETTVNFADLPILLRFTQAKQLSWLRLAWSDRARLYDTMSYIPKEMKLSPSVRTLHLDLSDNGMWDDEAIGVAELCKATQLRELFLDLSLSVLTDDCVPVLSQFFACSHLTRLEMDLRHNDFTQEGFRTLEENAKRTFRGKWSALVVPNRYGHSW